MIPNLSYRRSQLKGIKQFLIEHEEEIETALYKDLHKSSAEAFITEIAVVMNELNYALKHIASWVKPKSVFTSLPLQPAKSRIYPQPVGTVLIIAPWNYPLQLTLVPLIGALAAGNRVVLKPSELAPATSSLLFSKLPRYLDRQCIDIVEGDEETTIKLLEEKYDHIFFTGSNIVGKKIMLAAAENLTPVTLELGGKCPCIVDETANLDVAAKRIVWGKFTNAGQSCVAPDYVLVHESIENALIAKFKEVIFHFYGKFPEISPDYGRIINTRHYQRIKSLLSCDGEIVVGGGFDDESNYIAPTIMRNVQLQSAIMQDEIFGPILPLIRYSRMEDVLSFINFRPKPLAISLFTSNNQTKDKIIVEACAGSISINNVMQQVAVPGLPFGGIGASGIGAYHGKASFDIFSHNKSVLDKPTWFDPAILYPPYGDNLKKLLRWLI